MKTKFMKNNVLRWSIAITLTLAVIAASFVNAAANASNVKEATTDQVVASVMPTVANTRQVAINNDEAFEVKVDNNGKMHSIAVTKGTVGDILKSMNIEVSESQRVVPSTNTVISSETVIYIFEAVTVELTTNGVAKNVRVPQTTVENALEVIGYDVDEDDILSVDRNAAIEEGMKITFQQVEYREETTTEEIDFGTINEESDDMDYGDTKVTREGVKGEKEVTRLNRYVDGKLESGDVIGETIVKEAVDEIVVTGTKRPTLNTGSGSPVSYSYVVTGSGTAYTSAPGALTATGVPAYQGGVAVNPNVIPYGSKLYIESVDGSYVYGYATAVDTGGALMDGSAIVDLYYYTYDECIQFGRRDVNVYVLS